MLNINWDCGRACVFRDAYTIILTYIIIYVKTVVLGASLLYPLRYDRKKCTFRAWVADYCKLEFKQTEKQEGGDI